MKQNIIICGLGGQGILSISYVIDHAALDSGLHFKQSEVHGMAMRGGAVQSHLRYSDRGIQSYLIPQGGATMILSVEPLEAMRYCQFLAPDGWVVTSVSPFANIPDYPEIGSLIDELVTFDNLVLFDGERIAKTVGNLRVQNMTALGAASFLLDFSEELLLKHIERLFSTKGEKITNMNKRAFQLGRVAGLFYQGLIGEGVAPLSAIRICQRLAPDSYDPDQTGAWAELLRSEPEILDQSTLDRSMFSAG